MGREVALVKVDKIDVRGKFRRGENAKTLRKLASVPPGGVVPSDVAGKLETIGYRVRFRAQADGEIVLEVQPGRAIRRVRVRGHIPLRRRDVARVLSPAARPGSLAPGVCVDRKTLRRNRPMSVCPGDDLACQRWEQSETERLERYLFDNGFLRGTAALGLSCGKADDELDLYVYLNKGKAFRVKALRVTGNLSTQDQRWIRRVFRPTVGPLRIIPKRITRKHVEEAKERVAREYAEPASGPKSSTRRQLELPYPGVRVDTNFDRLRPEDLPKTGRKLTLEVDVQLGNGVRTGFLGNDHITENRLRKQLQLFQRREPATAAAAVRESENLRNYYQSRGYVLGTVEGRFQDFGTLKQLTFVIDEGPRARLRGIELLPTRDVPKNVLSKIDRAYRKQRALKPRARFTDVGARKDLAVVLSEFAKQGYLCARAQVRLAMWPEGLTKDGANAVLDLASEVEAAGEPTWLEAQLNPDGLAALRKAPRTQLYARLEVDPGPRVLTSGRERVEHLEIPVPPSREVQDLPAVEQGAWGAPRMLRNGPLRRKNDERAGGIPLSLSLDREAEREIGRKYRNSGYPLADAELRWVYMANDGSRRVVARAEDLANRRVGLCEEQRDQAVAVVDTELSVYEGRRAKFGTTLVRGNFKTRDYVLHREAKWDEGDDYNHSRVERTRKGIDGMGVAASTAIREEPQNCELTDDPGQPCVVHEVISITESKDRAMDLEYGVGGATLDPLYGFVRPSFPNMFGTAWDLQLDGHVGANLRSLRSAFCSGEDCYERSGRANLRRKRIFASPLTLDITGQFQQRVTPARGRIDSALGQVRLTYPITDRWSVYIGYLIQVANISKDVVKPQLEDEIGCGPDGTETCRPPNRGESIVPDVTGALQSGAVWQKVDNASNPKKGVIATADAMIASPWLGGNDWWFRYEFSLQHFIPIPRTDQRLNFRYFVTYGHSIPIPGAPGASTTSIPEVWRYFGGGTPDLGIRGIEPQTMLVDIEEIETPFGVTILRPTAQGGHNRALATLALQVTSIPNILTGSLAHSLFVDLGVLTQRWRDVILARDLRRSIGVNFIKFDIRIVTISLGYAVLIPNAIFPGNVRPTDDRNGRFVFDVGATF